MMRSKIEMYFDNLKVLAQRGSLKLMHVMYKANGEYSIPKEYSGVLINQGPIKERIIGKFNVVYANAAQAFCRRERNG